MARTVKLSRVETVLDDINYPVTQIDAAQQLSDVTVLLADGEVNLDEVIAETASDSFGSMEDLESELYSVLPIEAVGEPGQSEGEG